MSGLQELKELEHELSVLLVVPIVEVMVPWVLEGDIVVLWDPEETLERLAELVEEELAVDLVDYFHGQLIKHI